MDSHTALCHEFLRKMAIPGYKQTFILGCFAKRVTIRSQQIRALNLVHALRQTNILGPGRKASVIGGGFAGMTAAAAALQTGAEVTLLEKSVSSLSLQRNCRHRFLHPHIYDWPSDGSDNQDANLPLLNWRAGTAEVVVDSIDNQFKAIRQQFSSSYHEVFGVTSVNVLPAGVVLWGQPDTNKRQDFDVVILAVGFGMEKGEPDASYWADNGIDLTTEDSPAVKVLVSGGGDGALTDLMRLCIADFRHDRVLATLAASPNIGEMRRRVLEIENSLESRDPAFLSRSYQSSDLQLGTSLKRRTLTVYWAAGSTEMFTSNSSALNRFIVAQLFHAGAFKPTPWGRVERVQTLANRLIEVTFATGHTETFHRVVQRHGPHSTLEDDFPDIAKAAEGIRRDWSGSQSDWTNRFLLEGEPSGVEPQSPIPDDTHRLALEAIGASGYNVSSMVNLETIFVVVGDGFWQEVLDRPAAQLLKEAIDRLGDRRFRRAFVLPHIAWLNTPQIHANAVLSVGGPVVNPLTELLKDKNAYQVTSGVWGAWEIHSGLPRVALWGDDPDGADKTLRSVKSYLDRPAGLEAFLRQSWK